MILTVELWHCWEILWMTYKSPHTCFDKTSNQWSSYGHSTLRGHLWRTLLGNNIFIDNCFTLINLQNTYVTKIIFYLVTSGPVGASTFLLCQLHSTPWHWSSPWSPWHCSQWSRTPGWLSPPRVCHTDQP